VARGAGVAVGVAAETSGRFAVGRQSGSGPWHGGTLRMGCTPFDRLTVALITH
jgi:hypothetical protein